MGFQKIGLEIVAPIAAVGLALVWLCGWTQGRKMYKQFYAEELLALKRESKEREKSQKPVDDTIEDMIQKVIKERYS